MAGVVYPLVMKEVTLTTVPFGFDPNFIFDRPFLIVVKKRGAERPFFVMWVDNAELLCKP